MVKSQITLTFDVPGESDPIVRLNRFRRMARGQDERTLVLSLATFVEETLGRLMLAYFRDCKATRELINGFSAPLGTLGSRIKAAYAFGLINEHQYTNLELLRKIRNQFAHNWEGVTLERNDIAAMVGSMNTNPLRGQQPDAKGRDRLFVTMLECCEDLQVFVWHLEKRVHVKAPDVSRFAGQPQSYPKVPRYVT